MSVLNHVCLTVDSNLPSIESQIKALRFGVGNREGQRFARLNEEYAGGFKVYCNQIYAACFNYVSEDEIVAALESVDWGYSDAVA